MEDQSKKPNGTCARSVSAKWWRQVGFWGLTANMVLGFPVILVALWYAPEADWGILSAIYPTILAAWCAAAGIRQWGKNQGTELETPAPGAGVDAGPLD